MPAGRGVSPAARLSFPEGAGRRLAEEEGSRRSLEESLAFLLCVPAQSDAGVYFVSLPRTMQGPMGSQLRKDKMKPTCEGASLSAVICPLSAGAFFQEVGPSGHAQGSCVWHSF